MSETFAPPSVPSLVRSCDRSVRAPAGATRRAVAAGLGAAFLAAPAVLRAETTIRLKFGNDLPASHSVNVRLREAISAIESDAGGRLKIALFPNNQLGSDPDMLAQLRYGALELATMPGTVLSTLIPAASLTGLGFIFTDYDKVWSAMDGDVGSFIRREIERFNLHPFGAIWDNGFRQTTTSTKPIRTPDDLKNFKIRVPLVPLWVSMFASLGAAPTSIPLAEAYAALQTRIADGQENPLALITAAKFYEVQKFCSLTNHAWDGFWLLAGRKSWDALPEDLRQILATRFDEAARKQRDDNFKATANFLEGLKTKGLAVNETDPIAFRQALGRTPFYAKWRTKFGEDAWSLLERYTGAIG